MKDERRMTGLDVLVFGCAAAAATTLGPGLGSYVGWAGLVVLGKNGIDDPGGTLLGAALLGGGAVMGAAGIATLAAIGREARRLRTPGEERTKKAGSGRKQPAKAGAAEEDTERTGS